MSTKIINGFLLPGATLASLKLITDRFFASGTSLAETILAKYVAKKATKMLDAAALSSDPTDQMMPLSTVWNVVRVEWMEIKKEKRRHPLIDVEVDLVFIPHENDLLGMIFAEKQELIQLWMEISKSEDFSYWDNTEPPKGKTQAEWNKRGEVWDKAVPSGTPGRHGFSYQLIGDYLPHIETNFIVENQPSFKDRVSEMAMAVGR